MLYPTFPSNTSSLLSKYLTQEIFDELKEKKTAYGFTLAKAINSGIQNSDSDIGVYAGDEESYELFAPLFNKIIEDYHGFSSASSHRSNLDMNNLKIKALDDEYILSTRIRVGRNLEGFPLGTIISKAERNEVEQLVSRALNTLDAELEGAYYPLEGMSKEVQERLIKEHFLFKEGDRFLESAGLNRDWAEGRGIYHNYEKTFLVWLNEEDQLRIISMQQGGDVLAVFRRLVKALEALEKHLTFSYSKRLGYIASCPTNLGTSMRASVHIKLPKLAKDSVKLNAIAEKYQLQIRGVNGEHSESKEGIFDISNRRRLGVTEVEAIEALVEGISALISVERSQ